jgi:hypothetical protein
MCIRAFYNLNRNLTVKSAPEIVLCCLEASACGIFSLHNVVLSTNLEAPADFTILVLSIK